MYIQVKAMIRFAITNLSIALQALMPYYAVCCEGSGSANGCCAPPAEPPCCTTAAAKEQPPRCCSDAGPACDAESTCCVICRCDALRDPQLRATHLSLPTQWSTFDTIIPAADFDRQALLVTRAVDGPLLEFTPLHSGSHNRRQAVLEVWRD